MIVDTSALMAIILLERDWRTLLSELADTAITIPAPVLTELTLATADRGVATIVSKTKLVEELLGKGAEVASFDHRHADITAVARKRYGKGNGRGGLLNFGDLMVYAVARDRKEPLLCTGRDFASTDLEIHPASRLDP